MTSNDIRSTDTRFYPSLQGAGLGLRRDLLPELLDGKTADESLPIDFLELAPENWLGMGGRYAHQLDQLAERFPFACHGLSLSLGSTTSLDRELLLSIRDFLRKYGISHYTEHLSWCMDDGHLYDLLPIPCTEEAVKWVSARIRQTQELLEMPIGIENVSYYFSPPDADMSEVEFINAVIQESGCYLHLDVNNIFVNSRNFGFDAHDYLQALPLDRVGYIHVAGHVQQDNGVIIDTHGANVIDPVWQLLESAYQQIPAYTPTCLERDFNIPALSALIPEVKQIKSLQQACLHSYSHSYSHPEREQRYG